MVDTAVANGYGKVQGESKRFVRSDRHFILQEAAL